MTAVEYLLIYLGIGVLIVLWDFRKYASVLMWHIRYSNVPESVAMFSGHPKPLIEFWNMPGYARRKNWLVAIVFVFLWPIRLPHILGLQSFVINLLRGRIHFRKPSKSKTTKISLDQSLAIYENIVGFLAFGIDKQEWSEFRCDERVIVIHSGEISYDKTPENLGCPEGARHNLYVLNQIETHDRKTMWEVEEAHNPFKFRMAGHGSTDTYEEDMWGNITHIEQRSSWIS